MQVFRTAMLAASISALVAGAPSVWAAPLVFTDTVVTSACLSADAPAECNGSPSSIASTPFTHSILDSGFLDTDVVTGAQIELTFWDDGGRRDASEKLSLTLDLVTVLYGADANHDATIVLGNLSMLADGVLAGVLGALDGDFFFGGSTLTVWVDRPDAPAGGPTDAGNPGDEGGFTVAAVPGPAPLFALGAGLLLVRGLTRRGRGPRHR